MHASLPRFFLTVKHLSYFSSNCLRYTLSVTQAVARVNSIFHFIKYSFFDLITSLFKISYNSHPFIFSNSLAVSSESLPSLFLIGAISFSRSISKARHESIMCIKSNASVSYLYAFNSEDSTYLPSL